MTQVLEHRPVGSCWGEASVSPVRRHLGRGLPEPLKPQLHHLQAPRQPWKPSCPPSWGGGVKQPHLPLGPQGQPPHMENLACRALCRSLHRGQAVRHSLRGPGYTERCPSKLGGRAWAPHAASRPRAILLISKPFPRCHSDFLMSTGAREQTLVSGRNCVLNVRPSRDSWVTATLRCS